LNGAAFQSIRDSAQPVVALIEGFCIGGGLAIALACDLRVSSPTGIFALPPARLGLAYPVDSLRDLLSAVSAPVAKEMIFTARRFDARRALSVGLIDAVDEDPAAAVRLLSAEIAEGAPLTILHAKRAIEMIAGKAGHVDEAELRALAVRCFNSRDYAEGRAAFAEKRKPRFTGV
jgi:enoyl-CoA hydratase/carnithine racemase